MGVVTLNRLAEGAQSGSGVGSLAFNIGGVPGCWFPQQICLIHITLVSGTITTLSVTGPASAPGNWVLLNRVVGSGITSETWLGYNFPLFQAGAGNVTLTFSASVTFIANATFFWFAAPVTSQPANSVASASGTSTTIDPTNISSAAGDLVAMRGSYLSTTAPTAYTGLAPSGKTWETQNGTVGTGCRNVGAQKCAETTAAHDVTATIPNVAWAAQIVTITPPAPLVSAAMLYKGFDTALLDQGSPF